MEMRVDVTEGNKNVKFRTEGRKYNITSRLEYLKVPTKAADDFWRRRSNKEIMEMYEKQKITRRVRAQRVKWLGHIVRIPEEKILQKVVHEEESGKKRKGRLQKK